MRRFVAIKVLHPHRQLDPQVSGRFGQEIAALGHLAPHDNIVLAYHAGEEDGQLFRNASAF